jgi:excisionase family DNA binding protein
MTRIMDLSTHLEPYVSVAELAAYWTVSERTIYRDIDKGALRIIRVGSNGLIRIPIADARRYGRPEDPQARQL